MKQTFVGLYINIQVQKYSTEGTKFLYVFREQALNHTHHDEYTIYFDQEIYKKN